MPLQKGKFYNADTNQEIVTCQFNPAELTVTRRNDWSTQKRVGTGVMEVMFAGAPPQTLTMKLTFDSYEDRTDVRASTNKLVQLMDLPDGTAQGRPPHVEFGWGQFRSFRSVITSFTQRFGLFLPDGTPVRAAVDLTLTEVPREPVTQQKGGQNPTSRAAGSRRTYMVQPGDQLDLIAARLIGQASDWRTLADFNGIDDPRRLEPGVTLLIPPDV
jgi:nucleoid-associated protein YgaU